MVVAGLLVALLVGGVISLRRLSHSTGWVRHTNDVQLAVSRFMSTLTDAETGARGYIVGGDSTFLDVYDQALKSWEAQFNALRTLTADNPDQQQRLDRLKALVDRRLELLATTRTIYDGGGRAAALTQVMRDGKQAMDSIRSIVAEMETAESRLDETRQAEGDDRYELTAGLFGAGCIGLLVILGMLMIQRRVGIARRSEAAKVARANELVRVVLHGVDLGITVQNPDGTLVYANETAASILGFAGPDQLLAAPLMDVMKSFEVFDADGKPFPLEDLPSRAALRGENPPEISVRFRIRGTRTDRWSLLRSVPVLDANGSVIYAINFFREVTEKTRSEHQRTFLLRAVDELNSSLDYQKTLSAVARMVVPTLADWCAVDMLDGDKVKRVAIAHVDPAKLALVEDLQRRYPPDPAATTGVPQIIRSGKLEWMAEIPTELLRTAARDAEHLELINELQLCSYVGVPLRVRDTTIGALTFAMAESDRRYTEHDVQFAEALADRAALAIENAKLFREVERATEFAETQLVRESERRAEAEAASQFADVFIGILGHDLRNPLNAVGMATQLLKQTTADHRIIARIESSTARMSNMVSQLLDLARSRLAGGIVVDPKTVELGAVIAGVVDEFRLVHPKREIEWNPNEIWGQWDPDRIAQVISNLLGNALEHGDRSRPVAVRLAADDREARISVRSEGVPIPAELLPVLFDPYRRASARGEHSKGLGLGLFITQQIVFAHGGTIDVRSTLEDGTTFDVVLPRAAAVRIEEPSKRTSANRSRV